MSRDDRTVLAGAALLVGSTLILVSGVATENPLVVAAGAFGFILGGFTLGWAIRGVVPL